VCEVDCNGSAACTIHCGAGQECTCGGAHPDHCVVTCDAGTEPCPDGTGNKFKCVPTGTCQGH
ncbi:MAG TPA: hypothetical protein VGO62_03810, partial [Myxococcota bacterium]